jgi:hypothetical protein
MVSGAGLNCPQDGTGNHVSLPPTKQAQQLHQLPLFRVRSPRRPFSPSRAVAACRQLPGTRDRQGVGDLVRGGNEAGLAMTVIARPCDSHPGNRQRKGAHPCGAPFQETATNNGVTSTERLSARRLRKILSFLLPGTRDRQGIVRSHPSLITLSSPSVKIASTVLSSGHQWIGPTARTKDPSSRCPVHARRPPHWLSSLLRRH